MQCRLSRVRLGGRTLGVRKRGIEDERTRRRWKRTMRRDFENMRRKNIIERRRGSGRKKRGYQRLFSWISKVPGKAQVGGVPGKIRAEQDKDGGKCDGEREDWGVLVTAPTGKERAGRVADSRDLAGKCDGMNKASAPTVGKAPTTQQGTIAQSSASRKAANVSPKPSEVSQSQAKVANISPNRCFPTSGQEKAIPLSRFVGIISHRRPGF